MRILLVLAALLVYVWQQVSSVEAAYSLRDLWNRAAMLEKENETLRRQLEEEFSPEKIREDAERLGLRPAGLGQRVYLKP